MKRNAKAKAIDLAQASHGDQSVALRKHRWMPVRLKERKELSKDRRSYTLAFQTLKRRSEWKHASTSNWVST